MNNALLEIEPVDLSLESKDDSNLLREHEGTLTALIEAASKLKATHEWSTLKKVIHGEVERLETLQKLESSKSEVSLPELYRLQGRLLQARHHSLDALEAKWRAELLNIRQKLTPATSRGKLRDE